MALAMQIIIFILIIFTYQLYCFAAKYNYWKRRKIPQISGAWNDFLLYTHKRKFLGHLYQKFASEPYVGLYEGSDPAILIIDPTVAQRILITDFAHFTQKIPTDLIRNRGLLGHSIHDLHGEKWRKLRQKLTYLFTPNRIKIVHGMMEKYIHALDSEIETMMEKTTEINIHALLNRFAADSMGACIFGLELGNMKGEASEFMQMSRKITTRWDKRMLKFILSCISSDLPKWLNFRMYDQEAEDYFTSLTSAAFEQFKGDIGNREDILHLLVGLQIEEQRKLQNGNKETEPIFSEEVITGTAFFTMAVGYRAFATGVAYCLYEAALNPELMRRLYREIVRVKEAHDGMMNYDALQELTYMDCFIAVLAAPVTGRKWADSLLNIHSFYAITLLYKLNPRAFKESAPLVRNIDLGVEMETFRVHPGVSILNRVCTETYKLPDSALTIDRGVIVKVPVYELHRDPNYFPEPEKFDPERFSTENKHRIASGTYLPFGDGPRTCIAERFARVEQKAVLAHVIENFIVYPTKRTEIPVPINPNTESHAPLHGIYLGFKKRCSG